MTLHVSLVCQLKRQVSRVADSLLGLTAPYFDAFIITSTP